MEMQLLAEKLRANLWGERDTCSFFLQAGGFAFLEKHTLPPDCPLEISFLTVMLFPRGNQCHQGPGEEG